MLKGKNTDLWCGDKQFHVQTEDWGRENPYIVTRIFCAGRVIYTVKTNYNSWVEKNIPLLNEKLEKALGMQHDDTLAEVRSGKWL